MTRRQAKIVLIDFASWFGWTRKEIRELDRVFKRLKLKGV